MRKEYLAVLGKTPLFAGIAPEELDGMLACMGPAVRDYARNEYIALEGSPLSGIGCVLSGSVSILKENAVGDRVILNILGPGELFGEMAAFTDRPLWPASALAGEPSTVMLLPPEKIAGACAAACAWHTRLINNMLRILSTKALALNRKVEYMAMKTMRGKLCAFLLEQQRRSGSATFQLPMNRNELADYLNVSRPSMSRELGRMRDEGLIDFHMATVKLLNIPAIRSMVE